MSVPSAGPEPHYRGRLYQAYATTHAGRGDDRMARRALRREFLGHIPADRRARILDLGCGQGQLVRLLHELGYAEAAGIDTSEEQVELARQAGIANIHHAELEDFLADAERDWDVIVARDLLEHFDKPQLLRTMDLIHRALAPGGRLVARSPNASSPFGGRLLYGDLTHGVAFTPTSVRQLCAVTGFSDVAVHPCEPIPSGLKSVVRLVLWRAIALALKFVLVVETGMTRGHVVTQNLLFVATRE